MKRLFVVLIMAGVATLMSAQPSKRRVTTSNAIATQANANASTGSGTDRASLMFPTKQAMPDDVVWRRDVYRELDLTKDENAPLYYPVEPQGRQVNLFTYIFQLMMTNRIQAYRYNPDGKENFEAINKLPAKELLDKYEIHFEEKAGKYTVDNSDVPSSEVTRYYIKESVYLDQRTANFSTKITALCPILMRSENDFGGEIVPQPLFWVNYDELAPWLAKLPIMASNYNNASNMTADDYFAMNRYNGKIYQTNNLQGRALANYCTTDSAMIKEQKKIEKEISDFEEGLWGHMSPEDSIKAARQDSIQLAKEGTKATKKKTTTARRTNNSASASVKTPKTKTSSSAASGGTARVSARRQRR